MVFFYMTFVKDEEKDPNSKTKYGRMSPKDFAHLLQNQILKNIEGVKITAVDLDLSKLLSENLDNMFKLNDDLIKQEQEIEGYLKGLEKRIYDLNSNAELKVNLGHGYIPFSQGLQTFKWVDNKYPKNGKAITDIMEKIYKKYLDSVKSVKTRSDEFNELQVKLKNKEKGENDAQTLMNVDYRDIVEEHKDKMIETDFLCTMLCFVPTGNEKNFLSKYEELIDNMVVPSSAEKLGGGGTDKAVLYRVVIMKHLKDNFRNESSSKLRVQSREYNKSEMDKRPQEQEEIRKLKNDIDECKRKLYDLSTSVYSEIFIALLHIKFLRVYLESNLKYTNGEYFTVSVNVSKEKEARLVSTLIKSFSDTSEQGWYGTKEELKENDDFYPFILIKLGVPSII